MEGSPNLLPPDPPILQNPTNTINPLDLLMLNGNLLSCLNLCQLSFPNISNQILGQAGMTPTGSAGIHSGITLGASNTVPLAQSINNNPQGPNFKQNEMTSEGTTGINFGFSIEKSSNTQSSFEKFGQLHYAQTMNNIPPGPDFGTPQLPSIAQLQISPNLAQFPALPKFPSLPFSFSPPWMLNKSDESSGDSGIESRSSSMDFSMISPQNYRDYKMTRNEIDDLLEKAYRENNFPKMKTKKLIQLKTGMSIEAINQRLQKKRKMDNPEGTPPRKAPTPFPMDIREKLLEKYVVGGKVSLEEREELSKKTGLTLKQINDFYCKKNSSMRSKLMRNPELQADELENLARKYRKFNDNHGDEQNNCEVEGNRDEDGMRTWSTSRRNTYKRLLKMPNDEINKLIEAALQDRLLPTTETKENLCKITGLTMEALTTRMSRRRRKPFPKKSSSSSKNGSSSSFDSVFQKPMENDDLGTGPYRDASEIPTMGATGGIEEMEIASSSNLDAVLTGNSETTPDKSSEGQINVTIEPAFSLPPPPIKPEDIQVFLTNSYKNSLNPSFTEIEHWATRIGRSGSWVYQWIKHYRSINGYLGFEGVSNMKTTPQEHSADLDLDCNVIRNPPYSMKLGAVSNEENEGKITEIRLGKGQEIG